MIKRPNPELLPSSQPDPKRYEKNIGSAAAFLTAQEKQPKEEPDKETKEETTSEQLLTKRKKTSYSEVFFIIRHRASFPLVAV